MDQQNVYKILQLGLYPEVSNLIKGGIESSTFGLSQALSKLSNTSIRVICFPKKEIKEDYFINSNIYKLYLSNPYKFESLAFLRAIKIFKEIRNYKPHIVHLHGTSFLVFLIILFLKLFRYKYVVTIHGIVTVEEFDNYNNRKNLNSFLKYIFYSFNELLIIKITKTLIVNTCYVKNWVLNKKKFNLDNIYIIPQGIDQRFYNITDQYQENIILSIGAISERKGYEYSIQALQSLVEKNSKILYFIIGVSNDDIYYNKLSTLIEKLNLKENIKIILNAEINIIESYLSKANIFVLHSREESQGIAFCEAMAAGKPIIATKVGGIPSIIKDNVNGFLSPFGDITAFSTNIETVLQNPLLREKISATNRKESNLYSWSSIVDSLLLVYKKMNTLDNAYENSF